ncbi:hypothetical protein [Pseudomonas borbori]|uniref:hypothetical protein n=1 Tax=Pseudomonas borbori TaxID=289003 RepID=UPI001130B96D|nr:hypothetical protein [Pseudomonas borbori]
MPADRKLDISSWPRPAPEAGQKPPELPSIDQREAGGVYQHNFCWNFARATDNGTEVRLYHHFERRAKKEGAISERFAKRFEGELDRQCHQLKPQPCLGQATSGIGFSVAVVPSLVLLLPVSAPEYCIRQLN